MDPTSVSRIFLQVLFNMKMYHWQTMYYSRHQATDFFYEEAHKTIDQFVEVMMSRYGRVMPVSDMIQTESMAAINDDNAPQLIESFSAYLNSLPLNPTKDSDLISLRDDLLITTQKTLYLFSLR